MPQQPNANNNPNFYHHHVSTYTCIVLDDEEKSGGVSLSLRSTTQGSYGVAEETLLLVNKMDRGEPTSTAELMAATVRPHNIIQEA